MRTPASSPRAADRGNEPLSAAIWRVSGHGHSSAGPSVVHCRYSLALGHARGDRSEAGDGEHLHTGALGPARPDSGKAVERQTTGAQGRRSSIAGTRSHGEADCVSTGRRGSHSSRPVRYCSAEDFHSAARRSEREQRQASISHLKAAAGARRVARATTLRASATTDRPPISPEARPLISRVERKKEKCVSMRGRF